MKRLTWFGDGIDNLILGNVQVILLLTSIEYPMNDVVKDFSSLALLE